MFPSLRGVKVQEEEILEVPNDDPDSSVHINGSVADVEMSDADQTAAKRGPALVADADNIPQKDVDVPVDAKGDQGIPKQQEEGADVNIENQGETEDKQTSKQQSDDTPSVDRTETAIATPSTTNTTTTTTVKSCMVTDDHKNMWTAEEDLRLLDAISTLGLGNWIDISEEVAGTSGTTNKNPKKCMERYLYDFLGRYGEILPNYTLVDLNKDGEEDSAGNADAGVGNIGESGNNRKSEGNGILDGGLSGNGESKIATDDPSASTSDSAVCENKDKMMSMDRIGNDVTMNTIANANSNSNGRKRRRSEITPSCHSSPVLSSISSTTSSSIFKSHTDKLYKVVPTATLPCYNSIWPKPYIPPLPNVKAGDDVGRDLAVRAEQTYVKLTSAAPTKTEANAICEEWTKNRLNKHGGPTVLPPRPNDVCNMQGSDLGGFMPRRGDFDIEWDNEAESLLQDMEFLPTDSKEDVELKLKVLQIYNSRLDNRNNRKQFLIDRNLLDYRKKHIEENKLPADERDLVNRMRLFARFQSPKEYEDLIQNLLKAKRMRKEIAKLQMYRRMGFTSMADAERFELDRNRREIHRIACEQREKEEKAALEAMSDGEGGGLAALSSTELNAAYLKQYKQNDRVNKRKSTSAPELMDGDAKNENVDDAIADGNVDSQSKAEVDQLRKPTFDVRKCEGFELLTKKELDLCQKLELEPKLYNEVKAAIIDQSLHHGLLDEENSNRRTIFKIDVEKRGNILDFILKAGWVPQLPHSWHGRG